MNHIDTRERVSTLSLSGSPVTRRSDSLKRSHRPGTSCLRRSSAQVIKHPEVRLRSLTSGRPGEAGPPSQRLFRVPPKIVFFRDCCVSPVLESSCIRIYTAVLRAALPCTHEKILIFRGTLLRSVADFEAGLIDRYTGTHGGGYRDFLQILPLGGRRLGLLQIHQQMLEVLA